MNKIDYVLDRKFNKKIDLTGLRIIAMATMLIDHISFMVIGNGMLFGYDEQLFEVAINTDNGKFWYLIYVILRSIGRIAFPMFCFILVEGFEHSKNLFKYAVRLFLLAIISEIPFNLVCGNSIFYFEKQNTVWTLLLGLLVLCCIKYTNNSWNIKKYFIRSIVTIAALFISHYCNLDYGVLGLLLIILIYVFYTDKNIKILLIAILAFIMSFTGTSDLRYYGFGILSIIPLYLYNGRVGILNDNKMTYYLFYPLHLLILYGIVFVTYIKK